MQTSPIPLDQLIIEGYAAPDKEIRTGLTILINFINQSEEPWKNQHEQLIVAHRLTEIALSRFHHLEPVTQEKIFYMTQCLTTTHIDLCHDQPTRDYYESIIKLWVENFNYLQITLYDISHFLTPARSLTFLSKNQLDHAQLVLIFAVKYFKWLKADTQLKLKEVAYLACNPYLPEALGTQLERYQLLVETLKQFPVLPPLPSHSFLFKTSVLPLTWNEPITLPSEIKKKKNFIENLIHTVKKEPLSVKNFENGVVVVKPIYTQKQLSDLESKIENEAKETESREKKQLEKICRLFKDFYQTYFPLHLFAADSQQQKFIKNFDERFPPVAKELFFQLPSHFNRFYFQMLAQVLLQGVEFLKFINQNQVSTLNLSLETIDQTLVAILEQFSLRWQSQPSAIHSFVSFLTINSSLQLMDWLLNPDCFYFILDRLMSSDPWDLEDFNQHLLPLELFSTDEKLTKQLGIILNDLCEQVVCLGEPKGSANIVSKALLSIIDFKKNDLAKKLQQALHKMKSSPCSMTPLLILHHLFFHPEAHQSKPTWKMWQSLEEEEKKLRKETIEAKLENYLYHMILAEVKSNSTIIALAIEHTSSIQEFCQTLTQNLWQLLKKEESRKLLIMSLLQGVHKVFVATDQNSNND